MTELSIGVISEGTMRIQDTLPALLFTLEQVDQQSATRYNMELIELGFGYSQCGVAFDDESPLWEEHSETLQDMQIEIIDGLQAFAPPYCYVGTHKGDGACIGVFVEDEEIRERVHDDDIANVSDERYTLDDAYRDGYTEAAEVNDHGNMTLYARDDSAADGWRVVWAVV